MKTLYPSNLLTDKIENGKIIKDGIFGNKVLEKSNDIDQTNFLNTLQSEFAQLMATYAEYGENKIMFGTNGVCEINPSESNMIKMIFYLLTGKKIGLVSKECRHHQQYISVFSGYVLKSLLINLIKVVSILFFCKREISLLIFFLSLNIFKCLLNLRSFPKSNLAYCFPM
mgnify:CR=1 FL=1